MIYLTKMEQTTVFLIVAVLLYIYYCLYSNAQFMATISGQPASVSILVLGMWEPSPTPTTTPLLKYSIFFNPNALKNVTMRKS